MKDGSTTAHPEIKEDCRMKKNEEEEPNFYYFYFNIENWWDSFGAVRGPFVDLYSPVLTLFVFSVGKPRLTAKWLNQGEKLKKDNIFIIRSGLPYPLEWPAVFSQFIREESHSATPRVPVRRAMIRPFKFWKVVTKLEMMQDIQSRFSKIPSLTFTTFITNGL